MSALATQTENVAPRRTSETSFFDLKLHEIKELSNEPIEADGKAIGREVVRSVALSDGIDRLTRSLCVYPDYGLENDFTVVDNTAWMTTIDGYAGKRAEQIAKRLGVSAIQIGAEYSGKSSWGKDGLFLPGDVSLHKSAQSAQFISALIARLDGLSPNQYLIGDSRAGMIAPLQFPYAEGYGNNILCFDIKAPCVHEGINVPRDLPKLGRWAISEAIQGTRTLFGLLNDGEDPATIARTFEADPRAVVGNLTKIMLALASGQAGCIGGVPRDTHGHVVLYGRDGLSDVEAWKDLWKEHKKVHLKVVDKGAHMNLADPIANRLQLDRIARFAMELQYSSGDPSKIDWADVFGIKKPQLVSAQG